MSTETIAEPNDRFRRREDKNLGMYMMTPGVRALPLEKQAQLIDLVKNFNSFTTNSDPYGEHDFGKVVLDGESFYWKIDYYDLNLKYLSDNPADPSLTKRVMTIMQSSEY